VKVPLGELERKPSGDRRTSGTRGSRATSNVAMARIRCRKSLSLAVGTVLATVLAVALTGCGTGGGDPADGPIIGICGTNVGRAEVGPGDGPVYVNASNHAPSAPVVSASGSAPMNVRVSSDCSVGARISVSDPRVIRASEEIRAKNGAGEVLSVYPLHAGRAILAASRPGVRTLTITFVVKPPIEVNSSTESPSST
jgi:hypothetical protein